MKTMIITKTVNYLSQLVELMQRQDPRVFDYPDKGELVGGWAPEEDEDRVENEEDFSFGHDRNYDILGRDSFDPEPARVMGLIEKTGLKHGWLKPGQNTLYLKGEFEGKGFETVLAVKFTYEAASIKTITIPRPIHNLVQLVPLVEAHEPDAFYVPDNGELMGGYAPEEDEGRVEENEENESFGCCGHEAYWDRPNEGAYLADKYEVMEDIEVSGLKHGWLKPGENTLYLKEDFKAYGLETVLAIKFTYGGETKRSVLEKARLWNVAAGDRIVVGTDPQMPQLGGILWRTHKMTRRWEFIEDELKEAIGDGTKQVYITYLRKGRFAKKQWTFHLGGGDLKHHKYDGRDGIWRRTEGGAWRYAGKDLEFAKELRAGNEVFWLSLNKDRFEIPVWVLEGIDEKRQRKLKAILAKMK